MYPGASFIRAHQFLMLLLISQTQPAAERPSANKLSYSPARLFPERSKYARSRSQPSCHAARSRLRTSRAAVAPARVPRRLRKDHSGSCASEGAEALNVTRFVAVPSSEYFAVAGPSERFDRSRSLRHLARMRPLHALRPARQSPDVLRAENRPLPPRPAWRPSCETVA